MASHNTFLMNAVMIVLIALYIFGGETPMVSLATVTAVSVTQLYFVLSTSMASRVVRSTKKQSRDVDREWRWSSSAVVLLARTRVAHIVWQLSTASVSLCYNQLGFMFGVLVVGRCLQACGLISPWKVSLASPIGFVLGMAVRRALPEDPASDIQDCSNIETFYSQSASLPSLRPHLVLAKENPYNFAFWSELETSASSKDTIDKVSLNPSDILSDLLPGMIM